MTDRRVLDVVYHGRGVRLRRLSRFAAAHMAGDLMVSSDRPGRIFISYRREDAAYAAGWLYDRLRDQFDSTQIFKDVDSLQPGDDFVEKITTAVGSCDVLLAVIGPDWVSAADEHGKPRLQDRRDFVRVEIEAALARRVRVIPLLVEGARMPRSVELPPTLAPLIRRHAHELTSGRFSRDADDLVAVLRRAIAAAAAERSTETAVHPRLDVPPSGATPLGSGPALPRRRRASSSMSRHKWWLVPMLAAAVVLAGYLGIGAVTAPTPSPPDPSGELPDDVLVWRRDRGDAGGIATINVSGSGEQRLTEGAPGADSSAVIGRDRRYILFLHRPEPQSKRYELRVILPDRSGERVLFTDGTEDCPELHRPAVDQDGRIAVVCSGFSATAGEPADRDDRLILMQQDGTLLDTLARGQLGDPTFTQDGSSIVYWRNRSGNKADGGALYEVAADGGSEPVRLTSGGSGQDADPACSPVSDEVAFRHRDDDGKLFIQVIRSGQGADQEPRTLDAGGRDAQDPTWSPDATQIAFRAGDSDNADLWVMNADGSDARQLVDNPEADGVASWSSR